MGIQQFIVDFIELVNELFIPFILGMAFLVFIINVFRFFIIGGTNTETQAKAKSLAIYGVGAFAIILIFWGVVNILTTSLGLKQLGETTPRQSDYVKDYVSPSEQVNGGSNIAGDFGSGTDAADQYAPIGNNTDGFGNDYSPEPDLTLPDLNDTPDTPFVDTTPPQLFTLDSTPENIPGFTGGDYSEVTTPLEPTVSAALPVVNNDLLELEFNSFTSSNLRDETKMQMGLSFVQAGIYDVGEFNLLVSNINAVREDEGYGRITVQDYFDYPSYTDQLLTYQLSVTQTEEVLSRSAFAAPEEVQPIVNDLYTTDNYNLEERMEMAYEQYVSMTGTQTGMADREDFLNSFIEATNIYIARTGENNGQPITRDDVLGTR